MKISIFMNLFYSKKNPKENAGNNGKKGVIIGVLFAGLYDFKRVLKMHVLEIGVSYLV